MVADEDDDRAFFARNVIQCVRLSVGGGKPELSRQPPAYQERLG